MEAVVSTGMRYLLFASLSAVLLSSCWGFGKKPAPNPVKVMGYKPVYSSDSSLLLPQSMAPQAFKFPGKIYVKDKLIFQNDIGYGVHIIDNSEPSNAKRIGFIKLIGSSEISIKGNYLYSNSFTDLVVIDVSDWRNVKQVNKISNAFHQASNMSYNFIPLPEHNVYYECTYSYNGTGIQTGWKKDSVYNYSCYYP